MSERLLDLIGVKCRSALLSLMSYFARSIYLAHIQTHGEIYECRGVPSWLDK